MDEGLEFVWSLIAGVLYAISILAGLVLVIFASLLNWTRPVEEYDFWWLSFFLAFSAAPFGITRVGWRLVDRARERRPIDR